MFSRKFNKTTKQKQKQNLTKKRYLTYSQQQEKSCCNNKKNKNQTFEAKGFTSMCAPRSCVGPIWVVNESKVQKQTQMQTKSHKTNYCRLKSYKKTKKKKKTLKSKKVANSRDKFTPTVKIFKLQHSYFYMLKQYKRAHTRLHTAVCQLARVDFWVDYCGIF